MTHYVGVVRYTSLTSYHFGGYRTLTCFELQPTRVRVDVIYLGDLRHARAGHPPAHLLYRREYA